MGSSSPKDSSSPEAADGKGGQEDNKNGKKQSTTRRRTKTGCLTCRRRRIKCGEERPICKNCIKSKRECAGYIQPLVYKQQQTQLPAQVGRNPTSQISYSEQGISPDLPYTVEGHPAQIGSNPATSVPPLHAAWAWPPLTSSQALAEQLQWPERDFEWSNSTQARMPSQLYIDTQTPQFMDNVYQHYHVSHYPGRRPSQAFTEATLSTGTGSETRSTLSTPYHRHPPNADLSFNHFQSEPNSADIAKAFDKATTPNSTLETFAPSRRGSTLAKDGSTHLQYTAHGFLLRKSVPQNDILQFPIGSSHTFALNEEIEDPEDPWDVDSDVAGEDAVIQFDRPARLSPLLDEKYHHFFHHAMTYVVPSMNIFEREPGIDSQGMIRSTWSKYLPNAAVSRSALAHAFLALGALNLAAIRGTGEDAAVKHFTYALRRVGKMLEMPNRRHEASTLATVLLLGFYEVLCGDHVRWITHLAGASSFITEHDFAGMIRAVRRMRARARHNIEQPWVDRENLLSNYDYIRIADIPEALLHDDDWDVDQDFISRLMGQSIDYDQQEQVGIVAASAVHELTATEVDDWKAKMDLYWWYSKMDIFHSALSGDPLLRPYEQWKYCPPRGPIGRISSACATADHLWLVLARLVDFGGKDVKRKQATVAVSGGQWRPPPGFLGSTTPISQDRQAYSVRRTSASVTDRPEMPPSANEGRARTMKPSSLASSPSPTAPVFHGMIPSLGVTMPMNTSFHAMKAQLQNQNSLPNEPDVQRHEPLPLDIQLQSALATHKEIETALEMWESFLGPGFEPLAETRETMIRTPFGPAVRYRNPVIASTWTFYYMARILLRRMHPYSPPAAMVSTGVNAHFTRDYAQMIGRIVGGLHAQYDEAIKSTSLDAVLIGSLQETTLPLLFAAVQFQDAGQRGWTINKLSDVAENTGWRSSAAVASACEATWYEMGKNGKGPPYEKTLNKKGFDVRMRSKHHFECSSFPPTDDGRHVISHDRRNIAGDTSARAFWALGVLSVEEDLKKMSLG